MKPEVLFNGAHVFKNPHPSDKCVNIIVLASLHGNEVGASFVAMEMIDSFTMNDLPDGINELIIYPFINKTGIRSRVRDCNNGIACNLNDSWYGINYHDALKVLLDTKCGEATIPTVVIDIHNSPYVAPSFLLEALDTNAGAINYFIEKYNAYAPPKYKIYKTHRHTDIETIKSYVNTNYHANSFAVTFECSGMSSIQITKSYMHDIALMVENFIRFTASNFDIYRNGYKLDENHPVYDPKLAINLVAPISGAIMYEDKAVGDFFITGSTIARITDINGRGYTQVITAPCDGILIGVTGDIYLNAGECFGTFQPT